MRAWSNLTFLISLQKIQWTELYSKQPKYEIHQKMPMFEQLKNQVLLNSKFFWPLIRKILMWIFWVMLWSKSIPSTPIQPWGVIGAPLPCNFKNEILGSVPSIYTEVLELGRMDVFSDLITWNLYFDGFFCCCLQ